MAIRPEDLPKDPAALDRDGAGFRRRERRSARRDRDAEGPDLRRAIGALGDRSAPSSSRSIWNDASAAPRPANDDEPEPDAPETEAAQSPAQHRRAAGASAPGRTGDRAGVDALPVLHGPMHRIGEEMQRGARPGSARGCACCARSAPNTPVAPARARSSRPRRRRGWSRAAWRRRR